VAPSPPRLPRRAWLIVALLWFVVSFNFMNRIMLTTMHGSILAAFPINETQFGLLTSVFLWTYGLSSPIAGFLSDRFGRSRVIILTLFIWSAVTWLTTFVRTFDQLLVMRAIVGVCEACYLPAALALISEYHQGTTRSLATGLHSTGMVAGSAIGGFGGWVAEHHGWTAAFTWAGAAGVAYCLPLLLWLRDSPGPEGAAPTLLSPAPVRFGAALRNLCAQRNFALAVGFWGVLGATSWAVSGWMPVFFREHFHLTQGAAGIATQDYACVAGLTGMLGGGFWADRWSRRNPRGRIFVPVVGLCLAAPGLLLMANTGLLAVAISGLVLFAIAGGFANSNMMPILCLITDPRFRATGYGILNMAGTIAGGLAVFIAGALRDRQVDLSVVLDWSTLSLIFCATFLLLLRPRDAA